MIFALKTKRKSKCVRAMGTLEKPKMWKRQVTPACLLIPVLFVSIKVSIYHQSCKSARAFRVGFGLDSGLKLTTFRA